MSSDIKGKLAAGAGKALPGAAGDMLSMGDSGMCPGLSIKDVSVLPSPQESPYQLVAHPCAQSLDKCLCVCIYTYIYIYIYRVCVRALARSPPALPVPVQSGCWPSDAAACTHHSGSSTS